MKELSFTDEDKSNLKTIFHDLEILFGKDRIESKEIDDVLGQMDSEEAASYINSLKEAKPETALSDAFFAGRSILRKYLFETATPEATIGEGFIDFKVKDTAGKIILVELKPLFEAKTKRVKAGRELVKLTQIKLQPENHEKQILKYINEGGEYVILTNLKEWFFFNKTVTSAEFEPFATKSLMDFHKEFEVERNLWDYLTRLDKQSIREDLDVHFFNSLRNWVSMLAQVKFSVDESEKTELIINLINKFIFVQTLDDYRVIEPRWIQETWNHDELRWGNKGKEKVLSEFFDELDNWFYQYYDTELFQNAFLKYVIQDEKNLSLLYRNLRLVLGLEYWMSSFGGFRGVMQYDFRLIDEDILGKAYETFLAGIRHDEGIYYTPKFVTQYIVENTVGDILDDFVSRIGKKLEDEDFERVLCLLSEFTSVRLLDPACGSGSFLIKAFRKILEKYKEVQILLDAAEAKHNKWTGSLHRPREIEEKVEKIQQCKNLLGPKNSRELIARLLVRHIHGVDKDNKALDVAKVNIWLEAMKSAPAEFRYDRLPSKTNYVLPDLQMNFCNGDSVVGYPNDLAVEFLHENFKTQLQELGEQRRQYVDDPSNPKIVERINEIKNDLRRATNEKFGEYLRNNRMPEDVLKENSPFHWALEYWYFYFNEEGKPYEKQNMGVDVVIGNPPYERIQVLRKKTPLYVEYLNSSGFKSAFKNYDLAVIFIERGFSLLREGGKFGYIVSNKFMQSDYGEATRKYLAEGRAVSQIVDFGDEQVFDDATTYTALLFLSSAPTDSFRRVFVGKLDRSIDQLMKIRRNEKIEGQTFFVLEQETKRLSEKPWIFAKSEERRLIDKIDKNEALSTKARVFVGLQTSADPVFILDLVNEGSSLTEVYSKSRGQKYTLEKDLLKPMLMGKDIKRWWIGEFHSVVLFPYKIENGKAMLLEEKKLQQDYPRTWQYLLDNKAVLGEREGGTFVNKDWYGYVYLKNMDKFDQPKIMTQVLADKSTFSIDLNGKYYFVGGGNAGVYGIIAKDERLTSRFLCALLNSMLLDWNLKKISTRFRGGFYSYAKRFSGKLPIKIPQTTSEIDIKRDIESSVQKLIECKQAEFQYKRLWANWSEKLGTYVYTLKQIIDEDFRKVQEGDFEKTWTKDVLFYPRQDKEELSREYKSFQITGDSTECIIKISGLDESNCATGIYWMQFKTEDLMKHVYASIHLTLESRKTFKNLSDILTKTGIPVVTPNPAQQTINIIKQVESAFSDWKKSNNLTGETPSLSNIHNTIIDLEAKIDSLVFILYELDKADVATVMESLAIPASYRDSVLNHFDELGKTKE